MHTKIKWMTLAVLLLAGAVLWPAACSDLPGATTTTVLSSTTVVAVETTVPETVTTTVTTIAPTTTSAAPATTTTHSTAAPITTTTLSAEDVHLGYIQSVHHLLNEIDIDETRIPELVAQINSTAPYVPPAVLEELQDMSQFITMYLPEAATTSPAGYEAAQALLQAAANHMLVWINDLIVAIASMSGSGQVSAGQPYLAAAVGAQAAYTAAKAAHYAAIPAH